MTFCSAPSRIAHVLITMRSAALEAHRLGAAGGQQPTGHLLGVAPVHLAAQRPDVERRQRGGVRPVLGQPIVVGPVGRRAAGRRRRRAGRSRGSAAGGSSGGRSIRSAGRWRSMPSTVAGPRRPRVGPTVRRAPRRTGLCRHGSRNLPSGRARARRRQPRPPPPWPGRTSGRRPRDRRGPASASSRTTARRSGASEKWASTARPPAPADRVDRVDRADPLARDVRRPAAPEIAGQTPSSTLVTWPLAWSRRATVGRPSDAVSAGSSSAATSSTGSPSSRSRSTVRANRIRRDRAARPSVASRASSSGSTPSPRMCSSLSHSSGDVRRSGS